jgi:hypothetical protein
LDVSGYMIGPRERYLDVRTHRDSINVSLQKVTARSYPKYSAISREEDRGAARWTCVPFALTSPWEASPSVICCSRLSNG